MLLITNHMWEYCMIIVLIDNYTKQRMKLAVDIKELNNNLQPHSTIQVSCIYWLGVLLHSAVDTHLTVAVRTGMDNILESINTKWNQATSKPTTARTKQKFSKQVKSNDFIYLKDHYICMGDWVQLALF